MTYALTLPFLSLVPLHPHGNGLLAQQQHNLQNSTAKATDKYAEISNSSTTPALVAVTNVPLFDADMNIIAQKQYIFPRVKISGDVTISGNSEKKKVTLGYIGTFYSKLIVKNVENYLIGINKEERRDTLTKYELI